MEGFGPGSRRRRSRVPLEEETNRDGHWTRGFSARSEPWPIIEHWATERGFRLAAVKGQKRLYQKGDDSPFYRSFVYFKRSHEGLGMTVSAWTIVGFWARALSLFRLDREMNPEPHGFFGVRTRRALCRDLNVLLDRFHQRPILGSRGWHLSDLDLSLLWLAPLMLVPALFFLVPLCARLEIRAGLSNPLLVLIGRQAGYTAAIGAGLLVVQWALAKSGLLHGFRKGLSAGACLLLFTVFCIGFYTRSSTETLETRFTYYCLDHYDERACKSLLNSLSTRERELVLGRIRFVEKELSYGPAKMR